MCFKQGTRRSWFNLSAQEIQPLYYHTELGDHGWLRSRGCPDDAWNGCCSLLLEGLIPASHTSPVCAKCVFRVCFLFMFSPPQTHRSHVMFFVSQGLLTPRDLAIQDAGELYL